MTQPNKSVEDIDTELMYIAGVLGAQGMPVDQIKYHVDIQKKLLVKLFASHLLQVQQETYDRAFNAGFVAHAKESKEKEKLAELSHKEDGSK